MGGILGGGGAARREAEKSRQLQAIANDRQLAAQQTAEAENKVTRRPARGRRLFADDAKSNLS